MIGLLLSACGEVMPAINILKASCQTNISPSVIALVRYSLAIADCRGSQTSLRQAPCLLLHPKAVGQVFLHLLDGGFMTKKAVHGYLTQGLSTAVGQLRMAVQRSSPISQGIPGLCGME